MGFRNPRDAIRQGIAMIHQHLMIVPGFTNTENIVLGHETVRGPFLDMRRAERQVKELGFSMGLSVDPGAVTDSQPLGVQQRVEILKALHRNVSVLILDEPTAVLTAPETDELFTVMRRMARSGTALVFITHKLSEIMAIADRITVLRQGRVAGCTEPSKTSEAELARMMVGHDIPELTRQEGPENTGTVLSVRDLALTVAPGVSFDVGKGEILGIAGIQGNGQTELAEILTGHRNVKEGTVVFNGCPIDTRAMKPGKMASLGLAHIPEDRQAQGLVMPYSVSDNMVLRVWNKAPFARLGHRVGGEIVSYSQRLIRDFDIRCNGPSEPVGILSGGNQQKVVVARELDSNPVLLVAVHPTRGLDVGASDLIYRKLLELKSRGCSILLISSDLDEIFALSDRIAVMHRGMIADVCSAGEADRESIGLLMGGSGGMRQG
jgi:simple sugar transport system ATP-binding protein